MNEFKFPRFSATSLLVREASFAAPGKPPSLLPSTPVQSLPLWTCAFISSKLFSFVSDDYPDGDKGKVFYPAGFVGFSDVRGLVVMAHGELGAGYEEPYKYSMDHLGKLLSHLGYVCISVQPRPLSKDTSTYFAGTKGSLIRHLKNAASMFGTELFIKGKPVAFIGHSQAAWSVVEAAATVAISKPSGYSKVDAIISLGAASTPPLATSLTSYLGMGGTLETDGNAMVPRSVGVYEGLTTFAEKYHLWMHYCNHVQFTRRPPGNTKYQIFDPYTLDDTCIGSDPQNEVVAQYAGMFLLWKLNGLKDYRSVFTGEKFVKFLSQDQTVQADYNKLKVLPRFDRARVTLLGVLPGSVTFLDMNSVNVDLKTFESLKSLDASCAAQSTKGYVAGWNLAIKSKPRLFVECIPTVVASVIAAIEFHAVLLAEPGSTAPMAPANVEVYFLWGEFLTKKTKLIAVNIEPPWTRTPQMSVLSTIRIPMSMFGFASLAEQASSGKFVVDFSKCTQQKGAVAITGFRVSFA